MDTPIVALLQEIGIVVEDGTSTSLRDIGNAEWTKRVEGKHWWGVEGFGQPTTAISLEDGLLLYAMVLALKPKVCVEIGTHQGFSTCLIAAALKDNRQGKLHTFDIDSVVSDKAKLNAIRYQVAERVKFYTKEWEIVKVSPSIAPIDFFFDDSSHTADEVRIAIRTVAPFLSPDAHLAIHDGMLLDSVQEGIRQALPVLGNTEVINIGTCRGMTVIRRIEE